MPALLGRKEELKQVEKPVAKARSIRRVLKSQAQLIPSRQMVRDLEQVDQSTTFNLGLATGNEVLSIV